MQPENIPTSPETPLPQPATRSSRVSRHILASGMAVVLIVVVAIGSYVAWHNVFHHQAKLIGQINPSENHKYEAAVIIGRQGFLPSTLVVKPGTEVFFENHDTLPHKVQTTDITSNGTGGPQQFGSHGNIVPNDGYPYVFNSKGTYRYYDPLNPLANGEVVVN